MLWLSCCKKYVSVSCSLDFLPGMLKINVDFFAWEDRT